MTFIVKDKETGAGIANAYVYLRDGNHQMLIQPEKVTPLRVV